MPEGEDGAHRAKKSVWSKEEDEKLRRVLEASGVQNLGSGTVILNGSWGDVAEHLPGRSAKQCRERWRFNLSPGIKRDVWTVEEDAILMESQAKLGNQWALIARQLPGRTENSVKIRFKSIMRASKRVWTEKDDKELLRLHAFVGSRWDKIAARLPMRTRNGVKTRCLMLRSGVPEKPPLLGAPEQIFKSKAHKDLVEHILSIGQDALPLGHKPKNITLPTSPDDLGRANSSDEEAADEGDCSGSVKSVRTTGSHATTAALSTAVSPQVSPQAKQLPDPGSTGLATSTTTGRRRPRSALDADVTLSWGPAALASGAASKRVKLEPAVNASSLLSSWTVAGSLAAPFAPLLSSGADTPKLNLDLDLDLFKQVAMGAASRNAPNRLLQLPSAPPLLPPSLVPDLNLTSLLLQHHHHAHDRRQTATLL